MDFNINEYVKVKLTPHGRQIHRANHDAFVAEHKAVSLEYSPPHEDADGWSKWQFWHLMQVFGPHLGAGCDEPFDVTIQLVGPDTK